jgi:ADP-heptose:LPS heptosyltransferase
MNIGLQRTIDRYLGTFLCRILSGLYREGSTESGPVEADAIVVILLSEMGSWVLAYPMFQQIQRRFPSASLYGLLFKKNREIFEILDVTPADRILTLDDSSLFSFLRDVLRALKKLRRLKVDIAIDCELFARVSSILSFLSGARIRVGFHPHTQEGLYRGNFINRPVLYNPYLHMSRQFVSLVKAIDSNSVPRSKYPVSIKDSGPPVVEFAANEIEAMQTRLGNDFPTVCGKQLILIYPGGGLLPIRAWPLDYFCQLTADLLNRGYAVAVIGLAADKTLAQTIVDFTGNPNCIDLTGYTKTIRELMLIFQFASLLVTNDGGPGHFAAMTPVPSIIFYGPETPALYGPMDPKAVIFHEPICCSPCLTAYNHRNSPCDGDNQCLKRIPPERVTSKALEILEKRKPE